MAQRREGDDSVRLDEGAARRLIERATELDARMASQTSVADLREAALAAGISEEAFRRALEEVRGADSVASAPAVPRRRRSVVTVTVIALLIAAVATVVGSRLVVRRAVIETVPPTVGPDQMPVIPPGPSYKSSAKKSAGPVAKKTAPAPTKKTAAPPPEDR